MFYYQMPPDEIVFKLSQIGYPDERILSYPEIVIWLFQEKKCLVSVEPFQEENDVRLMGLIYFLDKKNFKEDTDYVKKYGSKIEETIKVGLFDDILKAYIECVNFIFAERFYKLR